MSEQPYNELGQILAEGGEIALATAIFQGWTEARVYRLFERKFEPLRDADREALWQLARDMVDAGAYLTGLPPDAEIDKSQLPINPQLGESDQEGTQEYYRGLVLIPGTEQWYDIGLFTTRTDSISELMQRIRDEAERMAREGKEGSPPWKDIDPSNLRIAIAMAERKY